MQASWWIPILWFALAGFFGQGLGRLAAFYGIERMGVSRATSITASSPLWAVLLAFTFLGERPGVPVWLGTLCVVGGVFLLSLAGSEDGMDFRNWFGSALIFPLMSSMLFAFAPIFSKFGFAQQRAPMVGMGVAYAAGTIILLAGKPFWGGRVRLRMDAWAMGWLTVATTFNIVSSMLFWTAVMWGDISTVLPLSRLTPLWVLLLGYLLLGRLERISRRTLFAAVLIVAGGILVAASRS